MKRILNFPMLWSLFLGLSVVLFPACNDDDNEEATPEPTASFSFSPEAPEVGEVVNFTSTSENADTFEWSFGDGGTGTGATAVHTYESAGDYSVTLIAKGEGGSITVTNPITVTAPEPQAEPVEVYFADNTGDVFTMQKISGLGLETTIETAFETTGYAIQVFFDEANQKVYYSDDDNGQVVRVNIDGSGQEIIAEGLMGPRGLAINEDASVLFVADRGADEILSVNISTGEKTVLYDSTAMATAIEGAEFMPESFLPEGLTYHNGQLYFTCVEFDAEALWKASADGNTVERLLDYSEGGFGYSVIVDTENNRLIFDNADSNTLLSTEFDGTDMQQVVDTDDYTYGIALDYEADKIYWSTRDGTIKRANRDGTEIETLLSVEEAKVNRGMFIVKTN
ncbi:PKD domain-containing protein [Marivirga sp. S37H4]|uniref:PKD domain-containing protein n=1 Tax=Marivirga aurantiaca TaxID=2802615 RepID=A0A935CB49_9BACT|nr:PKD domain-containing protein [Marivirga aurantiaca]MBK6266889.1 PKD domain-containing protein [Marivirga aurantiaca]